MKKAFPLVFYIYLDPLRGTRDALILSNKESRTKLGILLPKVFVICVSLGQFSEEMKYALYTQKNHSTVVQIVVYYCEVCCIQQHSNRCVLHVPEQWINGQFIPVMLSNVHFPLDHSCLTERKENIIIVSMKGVSIYNYVCSYLINYVQYYVVSL